MRDTKSKITPVSWAFRHSHLLATAFAVVLVLTLALVPAALASGSPAWELLAEHGPTIVPVTEPVPQQWTVEVAGGHGSDPERGQVSAAGRTERKDGEDEAAALRRRRQRSPGGTRTGSADQAGKRRGQRRPDGRGRNALVLPDRDHRSPPREQPRRTRSGRNRTHGCGRKAARQVRCDPAGTDV